MPERRPPPPGTRKSRGLLLALALAACARPGAEAARAVREYDDALVRAYREGDLPGLSRVATAEEVGRVRVLADLKSASGLVLESTIETFDVARVEVASSGGAATVETKERWSYFDRHLRPGEAPGPTFVVDMSMRYDLVREEGRLKVRGVRTLASTYAGAAPAAAAHGHGASDPAPAPR